MTKNSATKPAFSPPPQVAGEKPGPAMPDIIENVRLTRIPRGVMRYPAAIYDGSAPKKGSTIKLRLGNGTLYAGEVYDATEAEGQVLVEFVDGIHCIAE